MIVLVQELGIIAISEEPCIQEFLQKLLVRRGYRVVGYDMPHTVELLKSGAEKVDLLITNHPDEFMGFSQQVPILYIAAAPDPDMAPRFRSCRALRKPFLPEQLFSAVKELSGSTS